MNTLVRLLYAILIAAAVVTFIGVGIYTFYPAPANPICPVEVAPQKGIAEPASGNNGSSAPVQTVKDDCTGIYDKYNAGSKAYQRNVSIALAVLIVPIVAFGLWLRSRSDIIAEGLQLGGVGTSIYAVGTAVAADDRVMRFIAVSLFLTSVIVVVYFKFNEAQTTKKPPRKHA